MKQLPLNSCYLLHIHLLLHSLENRVNLLFFVAEERVEPPGVCSQNDWTQITNKWSNSNNEQEDGHLLYITPDPLVAGATK